MTITIQTVINIALLHLQMQVKNLQYDVQVIYQPILDRLTRYWRTQSRKSLVHIIVFRISWMWYSVNQREKGSSSIFDGTSVTLLC